MWFWSKQIPEPPETPELPEVPTLSNRARRHADFARFAYLSIYPYAIGLPKTNPDRHKISRSFATLSMDAFEDWKGAAKIIKQTPSAFKGSEWAAQIIKNTPSAFKVSERAAKMVKKISSSIEKPLKGSSIGGLLKAIQIFRHASNVHNTPSEVLSLDSDHPRV